MLIFFCEMMINSKFKRTLIEIVIIIICQFYKKKYKQILIILITISK